MQASAGRSSVALFVELLVFVSLVVGFAATPLLRDTMQRVTQGQRAGVAAVACAGGIPRLVHRHMKHAESSLCLKKSAVMQPVHSHSPAKDLGLRLCST